MQTRTLLMALAAAAVLAACGGGGGSEPAQPTATADVPASATVSATAYTQFAETLKPSDSAQPLNVQSVTPPTSETDPPIGL